MTARDLKIYRDKTGTYYILDVNKRLIKYLEDNNIAIIDIAEKAGTFKAIRKTASVTRLINKFFVNEIVNDNIHEQQFFKELVSNGLTEVQAKELIESKYKDHNKRIRELQIKQGKNYSDSRQKIINDLIDTPVIADKITQKYVIACIKAHDRHTSNVYDKALRKAREDFKKQLIRGIDIRKQAREVYYIWKKEQQAAVVS